MIKADSRGFLRHLGSFGVSSIAGSRRSRMASAGARALPLPAASWFADSPAFLRLLGSFGISPSLPGHGPEWIGLARGSGSGLLGKEVLTIAS
jgi:hypothetical protein